MKTRLDHNGYKVRELITETKIDIQIGTFRCLAFKNDGIWNVFFSGAGIDSQEEYMNHNAAGNEAHISLAWTLTAELNKRIDNV